MLKDFQLQRIILAESGANDGLGYPFLFLALYIIKYTGQGGLGQTGGAGEAMRLVCDSTIPHARLHNANLLLL